MATQTSGDNTQARPVGSDPFGQGGILGGGTTVKPPITPATSGPLPDNTQGINNPSFNIYDPQGTGQGIFAPPQQGGSPGGEQPNPFSGLTNPGILDGSNTPQPYQPPATKYSQYSSSQMTPQGGPNPYLDQQAKNITTQFNQNLSEQQLPGIRDKFIGSGGLGGSRQGIAEGLAIGRSNQGLSSALTNMYGTDYENSQNRSLQGQIASMNAATAANNAYMGNNTANRSLDMNDALQRLNSERNFFSTNRGQDLSQMGLAQGLLGSANQGFMGQGAGLADLGGQANADQWKQIQNLAGLIIPNAGLGQTQTGYTSSTSNPLMSLIGTLGSAYMMMPSDRRLKTDIEKVGKTDEGLNIYTYRYKIGGPMQMGVMAQEVEKKHPEAVGTMPNGYKAVNYGLLG